MPIVIDASVTLNWCFPDEHDEYADRVLNALESEDAVVPGIWSLEVSNALLIGERRGRIGKPDIDQALQILANLEPRESAMPVGDALGPIIALARAHRISSYDAAYLYVALREELPLATLDQRLVVAAEAAGCELFI